MQFFNTKKPAADTAAVDAAEEHKQSIGDQVMEALGVGDGAEEQMHPEENTEIMMPKISWQLSSPVSESSATLKAM